MTTEIATYNASSWMQPRDLDQAWELAVKLADASIVPDALRRKPADILLIMMYGMELDIGINQALRGIHVIKGRPSMSAELRVAKTRERGHQVGIVCADCGEWANALEHRWISLQQPGHKYRADWTQERCTVKAVRKDTGETSIVTWTVEDAIQAGRLRPGRGDLAGKMVARSSTGEVLPWESSTRDMLYARASDKACKHIAPEVGYGLYTAEEIDGMPDEPTRVSAEVGEPIRVADLAGSAPPPAAAPPAGMEAPAEPVVEHEPEPQPAEPKPAEPEPATPRPVTRPQQNKMFALFGELGYVGDEHRDNRLQICGRFAQREVTSTNDLTYDEANVVIDALEKRVRRVAEGGNGGTA